MGFSDGVATTVDRVAVTSSAAPAKNPIVDLSVRYVIMAVVNDINNRADTAYQTERIRRGCFFDDEDFFVTVCADACFPVALCHSARGSLWPSGIITLLISPDLGESSKLPTHSFVSVGVR